MITNEELIQDIQHRLKIATELLKCSFVMFEMLKNQLDPTIQDENMPSSLDPAAIAQFLEKNAEVVKKQKSIIGGKENESN